MSRFMLLLIATVIIAGCSSGGSSNGSSNPPTVVVVPATLSDFSKLWKFVADGELYGTIQFNAGVIVSDTAPNFMNGNVILTGDTSFTITEVYQTVPNGGSVVAEITAIFSGLISTDRNTMYGTYTWSGGGYSGSGKWCATVSGMPYLTNTNFSGTWDFDFNDKSDVRVNFDTHGDITASSDAGYIPATGSIDFTGGLNFQVNWTAQGLNMHDATVNIQTRLIGSTDATKTILAGFYVDNFGSYQHNGTFTGAFVPVGPG